MSRNGVGYRATLRLARRDAWRNRGRSALIALMIAIPVLTMSATSVVYRSDQREPRDQVTAALGDADQAQARIRSAGGVPAQSIDGSVYVYAGDVEAPESRAGLSAQLTALLPAGDRLLEDRSEEPVGTIRHGSRALSTKTVREVDYRAAGADGPIRQVSGRAPVTATEVAVTELLARRDDLQIGDILERTTNTGVTRLTVVGVVGGIAVAEQPALVARPGAILPETYALEGVSDSWLVVGPAPVDWSQVLRLNDLGYAVTSRAVVADPPPANQVPYETYSVNEGGGASAANHFSRYRFDGVLPAASMIGVVTVAIGLILLQVALLAGPAIAVGTRRNERMLALLAVTGGDRRHLRSVVLAGNGVIGLVGSVIAAALGTGVGVIAVGLLRTYGSWPLVRVDVHLLDLVVLIGVGTLTAVAAALVPARWAAKMDVVAVMTGRRNRAATSRRVLALGPLITLTGCAISYFGATRHAPFTTVGGIGLAEVGLVAATGSIVALAARGAGHLPFAARFALRDASRQRGRTAPAVAAVMAAVAGSIAVGVYLQSGEANSRSDYQPTSAIGAVDFGFQPAPEMAVDASTVDASTVDAALAEIRRTLPIREVAVYQQETDPRVQLSFVRHGPYAFTAPYHPLSPDIYNSGRARIFGFFDDGSATRIRTGVTVPAIGNALRDGRVVVFNPAMIWPDGTVHVQVQKIDAANKVTRKIVNLPAVVSNSRPGLPEPILPPSVAGPLGLKLSPAGIVVATSRMPSPTEQRSATDAVNRVVPVTVGLERGYQGHSPSGLLALVVAAAVITLGGTFTAVGLAAAESRSDVSTLAAVGAGPGVRRRLAAAQAAVITVLGAGLGLLAGLLAGWVLVRLRLPPAAPDASPNLLLEAAVRGWPFTVPWTTVAAVVIGVPLLAIAIGYLTTRSRLPLVRRFGQ